MPELSMELRTAIDRVTALRARLASWSEDDMASGRYHLLQLADEAQAALLLLRRREES